MWTGDARVARVARIVCDLAGGSPAGLRILDLACDEGNFAIELARLGAREVVGVEARDHVHQAIARAQRLGLQNVRFEQGDVRAVTPASHGGFDVVLCLGILYHLDTPDVFAFAENVAALCERFAVIETQISLSRKRTEAHGEHEYRGKTYPEDPALPGAAIDKRQSFWPTRPSLLNLLSSVGFTTVSEVYVPAIDSLSGVVDHLVLIAVKGPPQPFDPPERVLWPERSWPAAHPTQGWRWRFQESVQRIRRRGLAGVFRAPPT
jgi:SAM-dependent methyltransferase